MPWKRVVIDEAQKINKREGQRHKAIKDGLLSSAMLVSANQIVTAQFLSPLRHPSGTIKAPFLSPSKNLAEHFCHCHLTLMSGKIKTSLIDEGTTISNGLSFCMFMVFAVKEIHRLLQYLDLLENVCRELSLSPRRPNLRPVGVRPFHSHMSESRLLSVLVQER